MKTSFLPCFFGKPKTAKTGGPRAVVWPAVLISAVFEGMIVQYAPMIVLLVLWMLALTSADWLLHDTPIFHRNFSCVFQSANFNCWLPGLNGGSNSNNRAEICAGLKYVPNDSSFVRPHPSFLFTKFNGRTFYFEGDSISSQHFANFACRLEPFLTYYNLDRSKGSPCSNFNLCLPPSTKHPYDGAVATFSMNVSTNDSSTPNTMTEMMTIKVVYSNAIVPTAASLAAVNSSLQAGDVYVFNYGLHLHITTAAYGDIAKVLREVLPTVAELRARGVHVIWRETIAPQFDTPDRSGLWDPTLRPAQNNFSARCVDVWEIDPDTAWKRSTNAVSTQLFESIGVPVLYVWNATLQAPSACHIGGGRDCVHYCEPGVLNYLTDTLLTHLFRLPV